MANYTRRAANDVSQFLREGGLNSVHADEAQDDYALPDADLDMFMNREFVDFDTGLSTNFKADSPTAPKPGEAVSVTATTTTTVPDFGGMDFMSTGRFDCSTVQAASCSIILPLRVYSVVTSPSRCGNCFCSVSAFCTWAETC